MSPNAYRYLALCMYVAGVLVLMFCLTYFVVQALRRRSLKTGRSVTPPESLPASINNIEQPALITLQEQHRLAVLTYPAQTKVAEARISELAMDVNLALLETTRGQARKLSRSQAAELLQMLREELAIQRKDATPAELIQSVKGRLISLTEMLSEAQVAICDLTFRVEDIEALAVQLPAVIQDHRRHIGSLYSQIDELKNKAATKADVQQLQKELDVVKWAFSVAPAILLAILGALLRKLIWARRRAPNK